MSNLHATAGIIDTHKGRPTSGVCNHICSLRAAPSTETVEFVSHLMNALGMSVRWQHAETAPQLHNDCQARVGMAKVEFMLGTDGGTSAPNADQMLVDVQCDIFGHGSFFGCMKNRSKSGLASVNHWN